LASLVETPPDWLNSTSPLAAKKSQTNSRWGGLYTDESQVNALKPMKIKAIKTC
jgi:hypothetical protein